MPKAKMTRRTDRLGEQFREEISKLIQKGLKDPRVSTLASITRVDITEDLSYAKALVSVMGSDKEKRDTLVGLNNSAGYIRGVLGKSLKIFKVPELKFVLDENLEHAMHIEDILAELKQKGEL